ncbi:MAG: aconitase X catalytic domain-containing protein [Desulfurococcales archaeon]|nr:aconitase X catalytic domain-containing protein [Desulfurococcales archaeon]
MYLTKEEEAILAGEQGEAKRLALNVIIKVGEALGAEKLIPIQHAHISGISYNNIGEPGLNFIQNLYELEARFNVYTTINPIGVDLDEPRGFPGATTEFYKKQAEVIRYLVRMGAEPTMTCTPYYIRQPNPGEHLAWGESSAVAYSNSILGAWTNREGGPLALMAAILGKTYYAGVHVPENREPRLLITVDHPNLDSARSSIIGMLLGELVSLEQKPPYLEFTSSTPDHIGFKEMCAAAGASGSLELCIIPGTPAAREAKTDFHQLPRESITRDDIESKLEEFAPTTMPDMVFIGCPHAGLQEIRLIARHLKRINKPVRNHFWVSVSRHIYKQVTDQGLDALLQMYGIRLVRDTCLVVSPGWQKTGYTIATNSFKTLFYMKRIHSVETRLAPIETLIQLSTQT